MNESDDSGKAADMAAGCTQEIPTRGLSRSAWPSTKLLVVDDSEFEHQVIAGLLRGVAGLNVDYVSGGAAALEAVERETPDLILTDLFMPDMDGLELVQKVRSASAGRAVDPDDGLRQRGRGHPGASGRRGELSPQEGPGARPGRHGPPGPRRLQHRPSAPAAPSMRRTSRIGLQHRQRPRVDRLAGPVAPRRDRRPGRPRPHRPDPHPRRPARSAAPTRFTTATWRSAPTSARKTSETSSSWRRPGGRSSPTNRAGFGS